MVASDLADSCATFARVFVEASEECADCYSWAVLEVGMVKCEVIGHELGGVDIKFYMIRVTYTPWFLHLKSGGHARVICLQLPSGPCGH